MGYVIAYDSSPRRALPQIKTWPILPPEQSAFWFPDEADEGDTVIYYIGGKIQQYVAIGRTWSSWTLEKRGDWAGWWRIGTTKPTLLEEPVDGELVRSVLGISRPRDARTLDSRTGRYLVDFLRGRTPDQIDRAVEGIFTESRSRSRSPKLRRLALDRARGKCEVCGVDFRKILGGRGERSLVVHHKRQLASSDQPQETRIDQLAVVCANCHMLIHEDPKKARKVDDLKRELAADRRRRARR